MARKLQRPPGSGGQLQQSDLQPLIALMQQGKFRQAENSARKLAKKHPAALMVLDILSKALLSQEKYSDAAKVLETLVAKKPDFYDGHYNLGISYMNLGQAEKAAEKFKHVVANTAGSADAYTNLGAALFELERYEAAADNYRKAVELKPDFVPALRNLGASLRKMNKLEESESFLSKIPAIMPNFAPGHLSLGVTQRLLGKSEEAKVSFETALNLEPENREAHNELGNLHYLAGRYSESIPHFERVDTKASRAMVLEAMHQEDQNREALLEALADLNNRDPKNLRGAAFSAFASQQYGVEETHDFAPNPLEYVSIRYLEDLMASDPGFLQELMDAAEHLASSWENHTTRGGFQSYGNLFEAGGVFSKLEKIVRSELVRYREEKHALGGGIVRDFPGKFGLDGWHVKLLKSGHQKPHIHSRGWVSGVFYLKVPEEISGDEGAISFSLHGYDYRKVSQDIPELIHKPRAGELVLFPSSLFHSTIPFDSEDDRQCIAFDMLPF